MGNNNNSSSSKKKTKELNIALIFTAVSVVAFTTIMIWLFYMYQTVPDSLVVAFFGATIGETSACAMIRKAKLSLEDKTNKTKPARECDINGFDSAEIIDIPDSDSDSDLVIDMESDDL